MKRRRLFCSNDVVDKEEVWAKARYGQPNQHKVVYSNTVRGRDKQCMIPLNIVQPALEMVC